jgi:hypothetical protein
MSAQFEASPLPLRGASASLVSIAALVVAIFAILMVWIPVIGLVAWLAAPLGLVLGIIGVLRPGAKKAAIAAIILSAMALAVCLMWWSAAEGTIRFL